MFVVVAFVLYILAVLILVLDNMLAAVIVDIFRVPELKDVATIFVEVALVL